MLNLNILKSAIQTFDSDKSSIILPICNPIFDKDFGEKYLYNFKEIQFERLYANIISNIIDTELFDMVNDYGKREIVKYKNDILNLNKLKNDKNSDSYINLRTKINRSFLVLINLYKNGLININIASIVAKYVSLYNERLFYENEGNIISANVDTIFYKDSINLFGNKFDYIERDIKIGYFVNANKYAIKSNDGLYIKGLSHKRDLYGKDLYRNKYSDIISNLKSISREMDINEILE